ncbi:MAG: response regulator [Alphaproteobacteria bacterium]|nr:response regulator [Alphaproteobacteria bacterium]
MTSKIPSLEDLQQKIAAADALAEQKSNFLATMSHEIRTPMQTIYGLLELIGEEDLSADVRSMTSTAKEAASGLLEILDDILDFAKMDAQKMALDAFEVPLRTLVYGLLEALAVKVRGKAVELRHDIAQDVPFVITGDPKRLRQILMNLTGNALKFTEKGNVTIRVTRDCLHMTPTQGQLGLRFEVVDTGIGMPEDVAAQLFQPFTQADSSTARKFGGTGLGLSISKKLVEMMDGLIGVESREGKGSTFWFEIPALEVSTSETSVDLPQLDGISVLSVEDHPQGAKEIVRSLESMGATVESCPSYAEGLDLIKRRPFDVALVDQGLPDGVGLDLVKQVIKLRPSTGIIMYTVHDDSGLQHSLQSLGAAYLCKPASRAGLGEAVQDAASKAARLKLDGPTRMLIAEDTEGVQDVLRRQLAKLGVEADFVTDGKQALDALATGKYGILLTDLHMPEIDGYALVKTVRDREQDSSTHFPVIVLTADVQMSQRQVYMSYGFDECLLKPVSLGQFKRLLIRWGLMSEVGTIEEDDTSAPPTPDGLTDPAIDREGLVAQMGALDEGTIEMLQMFVEMTEPLVLKLKEELATGDAEGLTETAHSLKGSARSACATMLGELAARLQEEAKGSPDCGRLVDMIFDEFERVRADIAGMAKG